MNVKIKLFSLVSSAIGCPDLTVPKGGWSRREGENLQVQCNSTGEMWYLTCRDRQWIGDVGNCDGQ